MKKTGKDNLAPTAYPFPDLAMDKTSVWRIWGESGLLDTFKHIHIVLFAASHLPYFRDITNVKRTLIFFNKLIIADVKLKKKYDNCYDFCSYYIFLPVETRKFSFRKHFPPYWNNFHNVLSKFDNVAVLMVPISSWISTSSNLFSNHSELFQTCRWLWHRILPFYSTYFL